MAKLVYNIIFDASLFCIPIFLSIDLELLYHVFIYGLRYDFTFNARVKLVHKT